MDADHLTDAWTRHLTTHRSPAADLVHLHHLSHLQTSAKIAYLGLPRVTTLHGTELKLIDAMTHRIRLAQRVGVSLGDLARLLHTDNPHRATEAINLAKITRLGDYDTELLMNTAWQKWEHSPYWVSRLRRATTEAGHLVVVSEHDQHLAQTLLPVRRDPTVIPNGVDIQTFRPHHFDHGQRLQHLRRWLITDPRGWKAGGAPGSIGYTDADLHRLHDQHGNLRPILMWVGRFLDFKRVPVLLQAFAAARTRLDPAPILLMWGGYPGECEGIHPADLAEDLRISDDVFFVGWRGHDELPAGLNCADVMVAPAVNEPFGMVYLEAMACGTPPIATATGGPARTIIRSGPDATGWLAAPDDADDLARIIVAAVQDVDERNRRAANGRTHIADTYSWARTTDRYLAVYDAAAR
ncbi:glycosyltransferase family 4 protein [Nonomuraea aridisoli]|uniref:glycosyltransferase family 4 protein n=1 Tax=Nonomuraea aridisoli TaxID=2070368 RepID=UPI002E260757